MSKTILTLKMERYVNELIKGKSQREAYRIAYPSSVRWKDSSVDSEACKLIKNTKILQRLNTLTEQSANAAIWTRKEAISGLHFLLNAGKSEIDSCYEAYMEEARALALEINSTDDEEKKNELKEKHFRFLRRGWIPPTAIIAMRGAIDSLNKMHGFYKNVDVETLVNIRFYGDDSLSD